MAVILRCWVGYGYLVTVVVEYGSPSVLFLVFQLSVNQMYIGRTRYYTDMRLVNRHGIGCS